MKITWSKPEGDGWKSLRKHGLPPEGQVVDVWLRIPPSLRSMGMSDEFGVPDAWAHGGTWFHIYRDKAEELSGDYVSHWRDRRPGELRFGPGWGSPAVLSDPMVSPPNSSQAQGGAG